MSLKNFMCLEMEPDQKRQVTKGMTWKGALFLASPLSFCFLVCFKQLSFTMLIHHADSALEPANHTLNPLETVSHWTFPPLNCDCQVVRTSNEKVISTERFFVCISFRIVPSITLHRIKLGTKADLAILCLTLAGCWPLSVQSLQRVQDRVGSFLRQVRQEHLWKLWYKTTEADSTTSVSHQ